MTDTISKGDPARRKDSHPKSEEEEGRRKKKKKKKKKKNISSKISEILPVLTKGDVSFSCGGVCVIFTILSKTSPESWETETKRN